LIVGGGNGGGGEAWKAGLATSLLLGTEISWIIHVASLSDPSLHGTGVPTET